MAVVDFGRQPRSPLAPGRLPTRQNVGPVLRRKGICMPVMFRRGRCLFKTVGKRAFLHCNSPVFTHSWGGHIELIIIANYNGSLCGIWDLGRCQISPGAHVWIFPHISLCVNSNSIMLDVTCDELLVTFILIRKITIKKYICLIHIMVLSAQFNSIFFPNIITVNVLI